MKELMNPMEGFLLVISYLFRFFTPLLTLFSCQKPCINENNNGYDDEEAHTLSPGREKKDPFLDSRISMVEIQIAARGIKDSLVLNAMRKVKRHLFLPEHLRDMAYNDYPLPIGHGQTISQPYIVALMTELLELKGGERVLEIGTGSGYQSAILAEIASQVFSIEIVNELAEEVGKKLKDLGYMNIKVRASDGYKGWPEEAPFDAIIITAAPDHIPEAIIPQLKMGGSLVLPIGSYFQDLYKVKKTEKGIIKDKIASVRFVPMTGQAEGH
jgi:protein-L-isoaspartate(D-aspartate) O-methyltransferase